MRTKAGSVPVPRFRSDRAISIGLALLCWVGLLYWFSFRDSIPGVLQIGADEHFELCKAHLWSEGVPFYTRVWNNQPPLFTAILGAVFSAFGPEISAARLLAVAFAALLLAACFWNRRSASDLPSATAAFAFLLYAPQFTDLSLSPMLEIPAFAFAMSSLLPLGRAASDGRRSHAAIIASGLLMAAGLQTKLTAALVIPGLLAQLYFVHSDRNARRFVSWGLLWAAALAGGQGLGWLALGGNYDQMWASLFAEQLRGRVDGIPQLSFSHLAFKAHWEGAVLGVLGMAAAFLSRDARRFCFPAVFFLTVYLTHLFHAPWWDYYYLHFAIALALLAGEVASFALRFAEERPGSGLPWLAYGSIALLIGIPGNQRFIENAERINALPRIADNEIVRLMRSEAPRTEWVYTRKSIYAFHAGTLLIPELAVLPDNRFWSERITPDAIHKAIRRYQPTQLLLMEEMDQNMVSIVQPDYELKYQDAELALFIRRGEAPRAGERAGTIAMRLPQ